MPFFTIMCSPIKASSTGANISSVAAIVWASGKSCGVRASSLLAGMALLKLYMYTSFVVVRAAMTHEPVVS